MLTLVQLNECVRVRSYSGTWRSEWIWSMNVPTTTSEKPLLGLWSMLWEYLTFLPPKNINKRLNLESLRALSIPETNFTPFYYSRPTAPDERSRGGKCPMVICNELYSVTVYCFSILMKPECTIQCIVVCGAEYCECLCHCQCSCFGERCEQSPIQTRPFIELATI